MFNKLKQYKDLRSQAKTMQDALSEESVTIEKKGVKIIMDGNMKVKSIKIENNVDRKTIEETTAECFNDAIKKIQKVMAQKMQEMGGFPGMGS
ncbi:YbaB/EbfC family nucleoid-associated protein [bacterium]|nr:YbaB/EbfC family nucleoid-associated protein [bacterium]